MRGGGGQDFCTVLYVPIVQVAVTLPVKVMSMINYELIHNSGIVHILVIKYGYTLHL